MPRRGEPNLEYGATAVYPCGARPLGRAKLQSAASGLPPLVPPQQNEGNRRELELSWK
jgi:hypothetical protein